MRALVAHHCVVDVAAVQAALDAGEAVLLTVPDALQGVAKARAWVALVLEGEAYLCSILGFRNTDGVFEAQKVPHK